MKDRETQERKTGRGEKGRERRKGREERDGILETLKVTHYRALNPCKEA